jgi:hypothetical protein
MTKYVWTGGAHIKADAQSVGEELTRLQRENGERLTPRIVVDAARPEDSPLHDAYEWDNLLAAERFREQQAGHILRCVRVVKQEGDQPVLQRAFVNVVETINDEERNGYVPMARVLSDAELYHQVIERAAKDLRGWENRYEQFAELASIGKAARERVEQLTLQATA